MQSKPSPPLGYSGVEVPGFHMARGVDSPYLGQNTVTGLSQAVINWTPLAPVKLVLVKLLVPHRNATDLAVTMLFNTILSNRLSFVCKT